jgi:hypothetical protein
MTDPDRRPASISVPYSQTTGMSTPTRVETPPGSIPRTMSSVGCNAMRRIESSGLMVHVT